VIRYILQHIDNELILENAPIGWNDLKYTFSRNSTYHGLFRSYSGTLRFVKDGKTFIDNVVTNFGTEAEISIKIQELSNIKIWETKVNGILNFDPETYVRELTFTEVNFEDSVIHKKLKKREDLEIAYNRKETISGVLLPGFANETKTVELRGQNSDVADSKAVYPFEAFNRIIQVICDLDYNPVISSILGRPEYNYVEDGKAANVMLSKGLLMRGFNLAGNQVNEGETNLNLKFKDLFKNFDALFNIGLDIVYDSTNDRYNVLIEDKNYFFQTNVLFSLGKINDLKQSYDPNLIIENIKTGYNKFQEKNDFGLSEYNNKSEFSTPVSISNTELNLESTYRADGTAFQLAIENRYTGTEENKTDIDEDIFFIHAFNDSGTLRSVKNENFDLIDGVYGQNPILANIYISPARNMTRWGDRIRAGLKFFEQNGKIRFNKAENLSDLQSQYGEETDILYENRDLDISKLKRPILTGRKIQFNAPLTKEQISILDANPYGLVEFYDYIDKKTNYGWIVECSTDRVDKNTNWELWEAATDEQISNNLLYMNGNSILLMNGSPLIKVEA